MLLLLGGSPGLAQEVGDVRDRTGEGVAFVEWLEPEGACYVGQAVEVRLRAGLERALVEQRLVQPFRQPLDLPVQLDLGRLEESAGLTLAPYAEEGETTLVLDGGPVRVRSLGEVGRGGVEHVTVELLRTVTPTRPGTLVLPRPSLRFATASAFREDLIHGRVAVDREDARVSGEPLSLEVKEVPEQGRPAEFTGAVGRFEVWASVDRRSLSVGESLLLTVDLEGKGLEGGGLAGWPRQVPGFRIQGRTGASRRVVLDLAVDAAGLAEVPALAFVYFDPQRETFVRTETEPIPVQVQGPSEEGANPEPTKELGPQPSSDSRPEEGPSWLRPAGLLALVGSLLGLLALLTRARRQAVDRPSFANVARIALERLDAGDDPCAVVGDLCAALLACDLPGVAGRDLAERLRATGLAPAVAEDLVRYLQEGEQARFGGSSGPDLEELRRTLREVG